MIGAFGALSTNPCSSRANLQLGAALHAGRRDCSPRSRPPSRGAVRVPSATARAEAGTTDHGNRPLDVAPGAGPAVLRRYRSSTSPTPTAVPSRRSPWYRPGVPDRYVPDQRSTPCSPWLPDHVHGRPDLLREPHPDRPRHAGRRRRTPTPLGSWASTSTGSSWRVRLGAALAAVAGVVHGLRRQHRLPDRFIAGLKAFTAAVLGGIGNIGGAVSAGSSSASSRRWRLRTCPASSVAAPGRTSGRSGS